MINIPNLMVWSWITPRPHLWTTNEAGDAGPYRHIVGRTGHALIVIII